MKRFTMKNALAMSASAALLAGLTATPTFAQNSGFNPEDEIITTGTRRKARSAADAPAPVDVIQGAEFTNSAANDLSDLLRTSVPSYNVNTQPISDAGTLVRPANLRGLSPDNTLVLVNGKRRHRAAVITFLGGGIADGAQGPDVSVFPALALKQVEVLRDGASSQYGADAIAGVLNFQLKDSAEGGAFSAKYGSTYEGDGDNIQLAANFGLPLGDKGFINVTGEWQETDDTIRSVQRDDALNLIAAGNTAVQDINVNTVTTDVVQIWGQPEVEDDFKIFINSALEVGENTEVYAFGNYAERSTEGGFFFRDPIQRGGIFGGGLATLDATQTGGLALIDDVPGSVGGLTDLIASTDPDDLADQTAAIVALNGIGIGAAGAVSAADLTAAVANGTLFDTNLVGNLTAANGGFNAAACPIGIPLTEGGGILPDAAALAAVEANPNCFSFLTQFPGGFTPRFGGDLDDFQIVGGVRGTIDVGTGLNYDISGAVGHNGANFIISNTINAALGPDTPTSFNPGGYEQDEFRVGVDLSYDIPIDGWASDLTFATGAEWRREEFTVNGGDDASTVVANTSALETSLIDQGFGPGSNGFNGFNPGAVGSFDQSNIAIYGELEGDISDQVTLQGAVRWEDFNTFGSTFNWKVGGLYKFNDAFRVRGTYSTGFHAPTPGQANVINVSTAIGSSGLLEDQGILPASSAPAQLISPGASLGPEEARNISVGFGLDTDWGNLTVDYFNITVDGRIATTSATNFTDALEAIATDNGVALPATVNTSTLITALDGANVLNAADFDGFTGTASFQTFTNAFDTRTQGIDVVYNYPFDFAGGESRLTVVGNWTDTSVRSVLASDGSGNFIDAGDIADFGDVVLSQGRIMNLEENIPNLKGNVTWSHSQGIFSGFVRANYWGSFFEDHLDADLAFPIDAGAEILFDAEITANVYEGLDISVGAQNIFDNFPDENPFAGVVGAQFPSTSPFGFNGGQWYVKAAYTF